MTTVVKLQNALLTDLAHALTGKSHLSTYLLKSALLATDTEALTHNLQLTILQNAAKHILQIGGERFVIYLLVGTCVITRTEHVGHRVVVVLTKGGVDTHVVTVCLCGLLNLCLVDLCEFCQLGD